MLNIAILVQSGQSARRKNSGGNRSGAFRCLINKYKRYNTKAFLLLGIELLFSEFSLFCLQVSYAGNPRKCFSATQPALTAQTYIC